MNWYKKSQQEPVTFYHGTDEDFETFSLLRDGVGSKVPTGAIWFTDAYGTAQDFGETVKEVHLIIRNPYIPERLPSNASDIQNIVLNAKKEGYDSNVVGVFDVNQIVPANQPIQPEMKSDILTEI